MQSSWIEDLFLDKQGDLWIARAGGGGGLSRYDGKTFINFPSSVGLPGDTVYSIMPDKKGNLWFGTIHGVSIYDGKLFRNFNTKDGLAHNDVWVTLEDRRGVIWFVTRSGVSLGIPTLENRLHS